jgi:trigger factor
MESKLVKKPESHVEVTVTFTPEEWHDAQEKAFKKLAKDVTVKGFRKGNAPENLARKEVSQEKILTEALRHMVEDTYTAVLKEHELIPLVQPGYEITKISDTELELLYKLVVAPEVVLGEYTNLDIGHEEVNVDDLAINNRLNMLRNQNANLVLKEGEAELGDTVIIDFEGFVDDKPFEGGKAENFSLELGSGQFIPGFEDQLVGKKGEEDVEVHVKFPENYVKELAGKDAVFKVKVHEVKTKEIPELTDDFAKDLNLPNVNSVVELRMHVYEELDKKLRDDENQRYIDKLLKTVRESSTIDLAKEIVDSEVEHMEENLKNQLAQQGTTFENYLAGTNQTEDDLRAKMREDAILNIKNYLILNEIQKRENIEVTDAMVDFEIAKMAMQYKMEESRIRELLGDNIYRLQDDIARRMVFDLLLSKNN